MLTTGIYLVVALAFPVLTRRLPRSATAISALRVRYPDGRGLSRQVLQAATELGCGTAEMLAGSQARTRPASHRPARGVSIRGACCRTWLAQLAAQCAWTSRLPDISGSC